MPLQAARSLARSLQGRQTRAKTDDWRKAVPISTFLLARQAEQASDPAGMGIVFIRRGRTCLPPSLSLRLRVQTQIARSFTLRVMDSRRRQPEVFARACVPLTINISHERSLQLRYLPLPISAGSPRPKISLLFKRVLKTLISPLQSQPTDLHLHARAERPGDEGWKEGPHKCA